MKSGSVSMKVCIQKLMFSFREVTYYCYYFKTQQNEKSVEYHIIYYIFILYLLSIAEISIYCIIKKYHTQ